MGEPMRKAGTVVAAAICSLSLAGCLTGQTAEEAKMPLPDYRGQILSNKNGLWKDADSIKNASIAVPRRSTGVLPMWHVCVRANAKNSFGGYTGEKSMLIGIFDDNRLPEVVMADAAGYCNFPHEPFPELNGEYKPSAPRPKA
jgi:hypothetical protein